jgi:hypothetical protein
MTSEPLIDRPIFIVGCGRSGTTPLFDLLAQHPDVARTIGYPDGEDHDGWIRHGQCAMAGIGNVNSGQYGNGINGANYCLHLTAEDATPEIVQAMRGYYWEKVLEGAAHKRVLNKQPHLSNKLGYVLGIFPDARIVQIVRDCQPVVASWVAVMGQHPSLTVYWPNERFPCFWLFEQPTLRTAQSALKRHGRFFPGGGPGLWIDYWVKTNLGIEQQMRGATGQLCVVRYEDLVSAPQRVLDAICGFCELAPHRFQVGAIEQGTETRHARLVTEDLRRQISERTRKARRYLGYSSGFPWTRHHPRLLST